MGPATHRKLRIPSRIPTHKPLRVFMNQFTTPNCAQHVTRRRSNISRTSTSEYATPESGVLKPLAQETKAKAYLGKLANTDHRDVAVIRVLGHCDGRDSVGATETRAPHDQGCADRGQSLRTVCISPRGIRPAIHKAIQRGFPMGISWRIRDRPAGRRQSLCSRQRWHHAIT